MADILKIVDQISEELNDQYWFSFSEILGGTLGRTGGISMVWGENEEHERALRQAVLHLIEKGWITVPGLTLTEPEG